MHPSNSTPPTISWQEATHILKGLKLSWFAPNGTIENDTHWAMIARYTHLTACAIYTKANDRMVCRFNIRHRSTTCSEPTSTNAARG